MNKKHILALGAAALSAAGAHAGLISFQVGSDIRPGASYDGFDGLSITGGVAMSNVLTGSGFNTSDITYSNIILDSGIAGLGVCSEDPFCRGDSDSLSSNTNSSDPGGDEILFFTFDSVTTLNTVWFNGGHTDQVDGDLVGDYRDTENALFNVFYSDNGTNYTSVFGSQQQPTDLEYFDIDSGSYGFWAVAASGWGDHDSYIAGIDVDVPEPATLGLLGLGLAGLGAARRRRSA